MQTKQYFCYVKWLKNSALLASLLMLFLFGLQSQATPKEKSIDTEQRLQSVETIKSVGTFQSVAESQIQFVVKENTTTYSKHFQFLFEKQVTFLPTKFRTFLSRQDHNRCEKVSKNLFPFHFFW
ncbi:hypothetical protein [Flavobacterium sp.]|uniref:hypothetical protein n=1 Tax=Flavobacterium sp. TaxID=239 RepID=UPI0025BEF9CF|nr:hypothetical protein [Flavobacterium sp.]MBA4154486.1 hypothetical protein [Flavobacterium sp.]